MSSNREAFFFYFIGGSDICLNSSLFSDDLDRLDGVSELWPSYCSSLSSSSSSGNFRSSVPSKNCTYGWLSFCLENK